MGYKIKTTVTKHKKCMDALAAKCNWEAMSRLAVLVNYPDIVCDECKKEMDIVEVKKAVTDGKTNS